MRVGSFVHPFAQTPRPYTPPSASYQTSIRDGEYSRAVSVGEDEGVERLTFRTNSKNRTPSIASNTSPIIGPHPLRIQTKVPSSSRLAIASHTSLSDTLVRSPGISSPLASPHDEEEDIMSPTRALRASMEKSFRLRSHSEIGVSAQVQYIQEERRKFREKELAREEKDLREEIRRIEKRNEKEARAILHPRRSSASERARKKRSKSDLSKHDSGIVRSLHGSSAASPFDPEDEEDSEVLHRSTTGLSGVKYKAHDLMTSSGIWIRTRLLHMGGKQKKRA